jgi:GNAT superfamily N-acetyltransferase
VSSTLNSAEIVAALLRDRTPQGYVGIERGEMHVYEEQSEILGFSQVVPGEILALFVSPASSRRGVGSALMAHAINIARRDRAGSVKLESTLNAVPFYQAPGFGRIRDSMVQRSGIDIPVVEMESKGT